MQTRTAQQSNQVPAAAEAVGDVETARLAERMIWHETSDVEVLYPAALMMICSFEADEPELRAWALQGQCEAPAIVLGERPIDVTP